MSFAAGVRDWYVGLDRWKRRAGALLLLLVGLPLGWRSFWSLGTWSRCHGDATRLTDATADCASGSWEAWYRWPGTVLGLLLAVAAVAMLVHASRELRAERSGRAGRRSRTRDLR